MRTIFGVVVLGVGLAIGCGSADSVNVLTGGTVDTTGSAGSDVVGSTVSATTVGTTTSDATTTTVGSGGAGGSTTGDTTTVGTGGSDDAGSTVAAGGAGGSDQTGSGGSDVDSGSAGSGGSDAGNDDANDAHTVMDVGTDAPTFVCKRCCTYTQGWYKNTPVAKWNCSGSLTLGNAVYTQEEAQALLTMPSVNDGSIILARQLIAALENGIASDTNSSSQVLLTSAQDWLVNNLPDGGVRLPYGVSTTSDAGIIAVAIGASLDNYNQGNSGYKPHCQ